MRAITVWTTNARRYIPSILNSTNNDGRRHFLENPTTVFSDQMFMVPFLLCLSSYLTYLTQIAAYITMLGWIFTILGCNRLNTMCNRGTCKEVQHLRPCNTPPFEFCLKRFKARINLALMLDLTWVCRQICRTTTCNNIKNIILLQAISVNDRHYLSVKQVNISSCKFLSNNKPTTIQYVSIHSQFLLIW